MASKRLILTLIFMTALVIAMTGCSNDSTNPVAPPIDSAPPALPSNLSVDYAPWQQVATVTWDENVTDSDLAGYLVYRGIYNAEPTPLVTVPQVQNYFVDDDLATYRSVTYFIFAVDTSGNISAASTITLQVDVPIEPIEGQPELH